MKIKLTKILTIFITVIISILVIMQFWFSIKNVDISFVSFIYWLVLLQIILLSKYYKLSTETLVKTGFIFLGISTFLFTINIFYFSETCMRLTFILWTISIFKYLYKYDFTKFKNQ